MENQMTNENKKELEFDVNLSAEKPVNPDSGWIPADTSSNPYTVQDGLDRLSDYVRETLGIQDEIENLGTQNLSATTFGHNGGLMQSILVQYGKNKYRKLISEGNTVDEIAPQIDLK